MLHLKYYIRYDLILCIMQILQLLILLLFKTPRPDFYLVQNPPSIPTLFLVWFVSRIQRAKFFIDWHNFGYNKRFLFYIDIQLWDYHYDLIILVFIFIILLFVVVKIAMWIERFFGQRSDGNLCVTQAMQVFHFLYLNKVQKWLKENWHIESSVLYDRAPSSFHRCSLQEKHALFSRILPELHLSVLKFLISHIAYYIYKRAQ